MLGIVRMLLERRSPPAWIHNLCRHEEKYTDFQAIYVVRDHINYDNEYFMSKTTYLDNLGTWNHICGKTCKFLYI